MTVLDTVVDQHHTGHGQQQPGSAAAAAVLLGYIIININSILGPNHFHAKKIIFAKDICIIMNKIRKPDRKKSTI